ncbi:MAG: PIN domain-containing protein [Actinobacteria bacterium]|nr:PIN domain-containing protein [Actinomycetota bacterium]
MKRPRAFVDTNVLAYAIDSSDAAKQRKAQHLLETHGSSLVVSTQVLIELYAVCTRKLGMDVHDAAAAVEAASRIDVVPADRSLMLDAVSMASSGDMSVFDAAIVCAALRAECELLLTEDLGVASAVDDLAIVNPFV